MLNILGKPKRDNFSIKDGLVILFMGVAFIALPYVFVKDELMSRSWPTTQGTVISVETNTDNDGDKTYAPTARYQVRGNTYEVESQISSGTKNNVGDMVTVSYNESEPNKAVIRMGATANVIVYVFMLIGILMVCYVPYAFITSMRRGSSINQLKNTGVKIEGVITNIGTVNNGTSATVITVTATDPQGSVRDFVSDPIRGNTFGMLDYQKNPIPVDVYIDAANPDNHYVDISDIPSLTPEKIAALISAYKQKQQSSALTTPPIIPMPIPVPPRPDDPASLNK